MSLISGRHGSLISEQLAGRPAPCLLAPLLVSEWVLLRFHRPQCLERSFLRLSQTGDAGDVHPLGLKATDLIALV